MSLTSSASLHGTFYTEGMFVSLGTTSGLPDFGKILKVLIVADKASFITEPFSAWYVEHLKWYELTKKPSADLVVAEPEELNSYCPLSPYHLQGRLLSHPGCFYYIEVLSCRFFVMFISLYTALTHQQACSGGIQMLQDIQDSQ